LSADLSSKKSEIVQRKEVEFLDEKIVIESDVSNLCETSNSSSSSLDKSCVETVEIEEKEEERRNRFCFEFFAIDFALSCVHVSEIRSLRSVLSVIEEVREYQKIAFRRKRKEKMSFEIFNQYRESRSISNESDANLTQKVSAKRELSESMSNEKEAASIAEKIIQLKLSTTISSLQALQMLLR
jgi:C1A family cysteine protease